jgi:hypothetical protein
MPDVGPMDINLMVAIAVGVLAVVGLVLRQPTSGDR